MYKKIIRWGIYSVLCTGIIGHMYEIYGAASPGILPHETELQELFADEEPDEDVDLVPHATSRQKGSGAD
jgi:hypothetical protein